MRRLERDEMLDVVKLWWLFVLLGVVSVTAGVIFIAKPSHSLATLAVVFGIFILIDGIVELFASFGGAVQNRALAAIVGVLSVVVGIILIRHPTHVVNGIGLLIGIWLVAAGVVRLVRAIVASVHPVLQLLIAVLEIVVGIVIVSQPHIGYTTLAILTGIWLIINGLGAIAFGVVIRRIGTEVTTTPTAQT
jgi:uncharacterized membrane protein HdeD (DUF308 family)